jgi:hypothetical protein
MPNTYCINGGVVLLLSHTGPCPNCGKIGKIISYEPTVTIGVNTTATGTVVPKNAVTRVERKLPKNGVTLWRSFVSAVSKSPLELDGFEITIPPVTIKFKVKHGGTKKR